MKKRISIVCCMALSISLMSSCIGPKTESTSGAESSVTQQSIESSTDSTQNKNDSNTTSNNSINSNKENSTNTQGSTTKNPSPAWAARLGEQKKVSQFVVVCGNDSTSAKVSMHEKNSAGEWEVIFETTGYIGKDGLGQMSEYASYTPIGAFGLDTPFGIYSNPGCALGYTKLTNDLYWSGDHRSGYGYNTMVSTKDLPNLDKKNSEHLIEVTPDYNYGINIACNPNNTLGKGFAFFLHCYGPKDYTESCIAIPENHMKTVLTRIKPGCVIIIDYESKLCS